MTLVKYVTFVVLKILDNLVSMQNISKISNTVQHDLILISNVLFVSSINFAYLFIVLAKQKCC